MLAALFWRDIVYLQPVRTERGMPKGWMRNSTVDMDGTDGPKAIRTAVN